MFLFPSNGKAFLNTDILTAGARYHDDMFLFPSNGKAFLNHMGVHEVIQCIPKFLFPSNGKAFLNAPLGVMMSKQLTAMFLFPSNGKAFLNTKLTQRTTGL